MPLGSSITSITKRDDFSVGASHSGFTTPWPHVLFEQTVGQPGGPAIVLAWGRDDEGVHVTHQVRVSLDDVIVSGEASQFTVGRLFCHFLLDQIPDFGMPELCDSLANMYEFYTTSLEHAPLLPRQQSMIGVLGDSYERPEFHLDLE